MPAESNSERPIDQTPNRHSLKITTMEGLARYTAGAYVDRVPVPELQDAARDAAWESIRKGEADEELQEFWKLSKSGVLDEEGFLKLSNRPPVLNHQSKSRRVLSRNGI